VTRRLSRENMWLAVLAAGDSQWMCGLKIPDPSEKLRWIGGRYRSVEASIYYWTAHRIASHVTLCVLALPLERAAEIRAGDTQRNIRLSRQFPHGRRYTRQDGRA